MPNSTGQFTPRCSAIGGYISCDKRAWFDRAIIEGRIDLRTLGLEEKAFQAGPPADFGTAAHWWAQCALRCDFKDQDNDVTFNGYDARRAALAKYEPEQWENAVRLFADESAAKEMLKTVGSNIVANVPALPAGVGWLAETSLQVDEWLTGHIDLLSSDFKIIVDIKTTGKKPPNGKIQPLHFWQLVAYALAVFKVTGTLPDEACIVYAHRRGDWTFRTKSIRFDCQEGHALIHYMASRIGYLVSDMLYANAIPSFGDHCDSGFCPYRAICRDKLIPRGVPIREREEPHVPSQPFKLGDL